MSEMGMLESGWSLLRAHAAHRDERLEDMASTRDY